MSRTVRVTAMNHEAQDIACSPDRVYREILAGFLDGAPFAKNGFTVTPLQDSDPAAFRGGYRLTLKNDEGALVDDRICVITERDDEARRLSLRAQYLAPAEMGILVHATYQAAITPTGAQFRLDCHTDLDVDIPAADAGETIEDKVKGFETESANHLKGFLARVKDKLEAEVKGAA